MKKQDSQQNSKWYEKKSGKNFSGSKTKPASKKKEKIQFHEEAESGFRKKTRPSVSARQKKDPVFVKCLDRLLDSSSVPADGKKILENFQETINSTHPLNSKQKALMYDQIRDLSHYLTDQRGERRLGYMNQPSTLSAYVHYFLWWNLVRLTRLFSNLPADFLDLDENDVCLDVGSGPLTVPLALYISRPELRNKKLKWYCMDISSQALSIGENLMMTVSVSLGGQMWEIIRVKGNFGTEIKEKASFVSCANVFNEILEDRNMPPDYLAKKCTESILPYTDQKSDGTRVLLIEPGIPSSARILSFIREAFMRRDYVPVSPCTHCASCAMDGKKGGKWCNFAFSTEDAPIVLKKISEKSNLSKDRAVLSFLALKKSAAQDDDPDKLVFRIASDPIRLPGNRTGYYACSKIGLLLVVTGASLFYGDSLSVDFPKKELPLDEKSGAYVLKLE